MCVKYYFDMHSNMRYIIPIPILLRRSGDLIESLHNSDLIRGNIDTFILRVLSDGDNYGYQIIKEISREAGIDLS